MLVIYNFILIFILFNFSYSTWSITIEQLNQASSCRKCSRYSWVTHSTSICVLLYGGQSNWEDCQQVDSHTNGWFILGYDTWWFTYEWYWSRSIIYCFNLYFIFILNNVVLCFTLHIKLDVVIVWICLMYDNSMMTY